MDTTRLPTWILIAAAAGALGLGGLWWSAHAPPAGSVAGSPVTLRADAGIDGRLVQVGPGSFPRPEIADPEEVSSRLDTRAGRVEGGAGTGRVEIGAGADWRDGVVPLSDGLLAGLLPERDGLVFRQGAELEPDTSVQYMGPAPSDGAYQLDLLCLSLAEPAEVGLEVTFADRRTRAETVPCDETVMSIDFTYQAGYTAVELSAGPEGPVLVAVQLVRG